MSAFSSVSALPSAAVRTMAPIPSRRVFSTIAWSLSRSSGSSILRGVAMRPGRLHLDVLGEGLVPVLVGIEPDPGHDEIAGVKEAGLLHPDVHEGGLHPREHPDDPPLVDVADDVPVIAALEEELDEDAGLERRDTRLVRGGVDDDELVPFLHLISSGGG